MLFSQQFFYLLIGLGIIFGVPAFWMFARAMWPRMAEKSRMVASKGLLVNFLLGLPILALVIAQLSIISKAGQVGGLIAVGIASIVTVWGLAGLTGLAMHVGERLWPGCTGDEAWRGLWRGGLVIAGVLAIPFIGWYVLVTVLLTVGLGVRVRMWFTRAPQAQLQYQPQIMAAPQLPPYPLPMTQPVLPPNVALQESAPPFPQGAI